MDEHLIAAAKFTTFVRFFAASGTQKFQFSSFKHPQESIGATNKLLLVVASVHTHVRRLGAALSVITIEGAIAGASHLRANACDGECQQSEHGEHLAHDGDWTVFRLNYDDGVTSVVSFIVLI